MSCCAPPGADEFFDARMAARESSRFRRRGLPERARRLLEAIRSSTDLGGATTFEVGGGVGGFSIELLRAGAASAGIVDASVASVAAARQLAEATGFGERLDIHHASYGATPTEPVDIVVMDRVVCCDPDWERLLRTATLQAQRAIALTYPRDAWWTALLVRTANLGLRLLRRVFRMQHHPPRAMLASLREAGFSPDIVGHYWMWELVIATR
ncbi:MAG: methyltransferase domain-containing protein [Gemmatimonadetes bacterium]|nr:methyltransferase domain-containing protein [Gemmatimonadota bacterium]